MIYLWKNEVKEKGRKKKKRERRRGGVGVDGIPALGAFLGQIFSPSLPPRLPPFIPLWPPPPHSLPDYSHVKECGLPW